MSLAARFKKLRPHLKDTTVKTYVSSINRLKRVDKHLDYAPISNYLKSLSVSVAVSVLSALIVLEGRERFGRLYDDLISDNEKMRGHQKFSSAELKNWTSSKEIKEGIQRIRFEVTKIGLLDRPRQLKAKEFQILQHLLVLTFYSEFHFRSDLVSVRIGKHTGENYFHAGKLYLNKFKTAKQFKARGLLPQIFTPSRRLAPLLRKFLDIRARQPDIKHDFLICNGKWKPFKRDTFYKYLSGITWRYIGKRFGTSMLRKVYVTEFLAKQPGLHERKKFLHGMQQLSIETQETYRRLYKPKD
jgi:hypothetical protein